MKLRYNHVFLLGLLLLTSACAKREFAFMGLPKPPTDGPPEYIEGWKGGCETGMSAWSNDTIRTVYSINVDPMKMKNPYYNKGWNLGNDYCRFYAASYLWNGYLDDPDARANAPSDLRTGDTWVPHREFDFFKGWDVQW